MSSSWLNATVTQSGETVNIDLAGENVLSGRTSEGYVAAEEVTNTASTLFSGRVLDGSNAITGTVVFFDKHACPEAETGQSRVLMIRTGS